MKFIASIFFFCVMLLFNYALSYGQMGPRVELPGIYNFARNEYGSNDGPVPIAPDDKFSVVVDPSLKPHNFISSSEYYHRKQPLNLDTSAFSLVIKGWKTMTPAEKNVVMAKEKTRHSAAADSVHLANNKDQMLVYFINNTNEDVYLAMQDWQFAGVLQALNKDNQWKDIEFWEFSMCGNSYLTRPVKARTSAVFIVPAIKKGDYKTSLRYIVHGYSGLLYSNEFEADIDYKYLENRPKMQADFASYRSRFFGRNNLLNMPITLSGR